MLHWHDSWARQKWRTYAIPDFGQKYKSPGPSKGPGLRKPDEYSVVESSARRAPMLSPQAVPLARGHAVWVRSLRRTVTSATSPIRFLAIASSSDLETSSERRTFIDPATANAAAFHSRSAGRPSSALLLRRWRGLRSDRARRAHPAVGARGERPTFGLSDRLALTSVHGSRTIFAFPARSLAVRAVHRSRLERLFVRVKVHAHGLAKPRRSAVLQRVLRSSAARRWLSSCSRMSRSSRMTRNRSTASP